MFCSDKKAFSYEQAQRKLDFCKRKGLASKSIYQCRHCQRYHLTHYNPREFEIPRAIKYGQRRGWV